MVLIRTTDGTGLQLAPISRLSISTCCGVCVTVTCVCAAAHVTFRVTCTPWVLPSHTAPVSVYVYVPGVPYYCCYTVLSCPVLRSTAVSHSMCAYVSHVCLYPSCVCVWMRAVLVRCVCVCVYVSWPYTMIQCCGTARLLHPPSCWLSHANNETHPWTTNTQTQTQTQTHTDTDTDTHTDTDRLTTVTVTPIPTPTPTSTVPSTSLSLHHVVGRQIHHPASWLHPHPVHDIITRCCDSISTSALVSCG